MPFRRLALAVLGSFTLAVAACSEVQIVEVEVIKTVTIEVVKEVTVEVPIEVQKVVTVEVPVEKIVIATPTPSSPEPGSASQSWFYEADTDPVSQKVSHLAGLASISSSDLFSVIGVRCDLNQDDSFEVYVGFVGEYIGGNDKNHVEVEYRFADSSPVAENWNSSVSNESVFAPEDVEEAFARQLISASSLAFRAIDYDEGVRFLAEFTLDGQSDPNHPVRRVMSACGWDMDIGG